MELVVFYPLAGIVAVLSVLTISVKNPVVAAICLVLDLFFLAGIYAMQGADFVAAIQVIIYAGAILVVFLFVIMLLNVAEHEVSRIKITAAGVGGLLLVSIGWLIFLVQVNSHDNLPATQTLSAAFGDTYSVGMRLFTKYLWPFELASLLILLAIVASVVIARKPPQSS